MRANTTMNEETAVVTFGDLVRVYIDKELSQLRYDSQVTILCELRNHILPRWASTPLAEMNEPLAVKEWLAELDLGSSIKKKMRSRIRVLINYAILRRDLPRGTVNDIIPDYVVIKEATKKVRASRDLKPWEFRLLERHTPEEPWHTVVMLRGGTGLRISESLALKWYDITWQERKIDVSRSIVRGVVDEVKSTASGEPVFFDERLEKVLKDWREIAECNEDRDWIFGSPYSQGRMCPLKGCDCGRRPWSYSKAYDVIRKAGERAGLGRVATHALRHTHRSFAQKAGVDDETQQKMMRHADLGTTKSYGGVYDTEKRAGFEKVADLVFGSVKGSLVVREK